MCDVCNSLTINTYLAKRWADQFEEKGRAVPEVLSQPIASDEVHNILTDVHYGDEGHAFFNSGGVHTYQDLIDRLSDLSAEPVMHNARTDRDGWWLSGLPSATCWKQHTQNPCHIFKGKGFLIGMYKRTIPPFQP